MKSQFCCFVCCVTITSQLLFFAACTDNETPQPDSTSPTTLTATVADTLLSRFASYESLSVTLTGLQGDDGPIVVSTTADWLTLQTDTLPADGIVSLTTTDNPGMARREAQLTFATASGRKAALLLVQLSIADDEDNAVPQTDGFLGYGYDIFQGLDDPMSVRKTRPVISMVQLRQRDYIDTYETVHRSRLSRTEMKVYASRSLYEFSSELTASASNIPTTILGCARNCQRVRQTTTTSELVESNIGLGALVKTVWSVAIDRGAIQEMQRSRYVFLDPVFDRAQADIRNQRGDMRTYAINRLLDTYGTHIVLQADFGGKLEYTFTMQKMGTSNMQQAMTEEARFTLGQSTQSDRRQTHTALTSSKQAEGALRVFGGSEDVRSILESDIAHLDNNSQIDPAHLMQWLGSINYNGDSGDPALAVIHFDLLPIWEVVSSDIRNEVMAAVLDRASRSDVQLRDEQLQTDLYWMDISSALHFDESADKSLSRILYVKGTPVLNICHEYIPQIRSDQRVSVAYPIYNNKVRMSQGLFLGDGCHQPAYVMFSDADCYVETIDTLSPDTRLSHVAYVGGNLYPDRHNLPFQTVSAEAHDDMFIYRYAGITYATPVLKVGSAFWTRCDIPHGMGFSPNPYDDDDIRDKFTDGVLFTRFQYDVTATVQRINSWNYGFVANSRYASANNTLWYLPQSEQVRNLHGFLSHSPKALFRGGLSGFNAQFNGYLGAADILNQNAIGTSGHHGKGQLNIVASKVSSQQDDACLMILDSHYRLLLIDDQTYPGEDARQWRTNYYPVRLCRGPCYEFPNLATMQEKYPDY